MEELRDHLLRLLAAMVAGALIGFERELHDKPAGFRTNTLICVGASLFTILSLRLGQGGDSARIAAQIVTGVGFLGAGAILQSRGTVLGLTTAATIWTVASLGMAFGAGHFALGAAATVIVHGILVLLIPIESMIARRRKDAHLEIELEPDCSATEIRQAVTSAGLICKSWSIAKNDGSIIVRTEIIGSRPKIDAIQEQLAEDRRVRAITRT